MGRGVNKKEMHFLNEGFMLEFKRKQNLNGVPYREGKLSFLDNDEVWSSAKSLKRGLRDFTTSIPPHLHLS